MDSVAVDGNIAGSGEPDGSFDFFDGFDDGSLTNPPRSAFVCVAPVSESDGFLNLRLSPALVGAECRCLLIHNSATTSRKLPPRLGDCRGCETGSGAGLRLFLFWRV